MCMMAKVKEQAIEGLKGRCTIVGVKETEYSRDWGRAEMSLAVEAAKKAIADSGLLPQDIEDHNGIVTVEFAGDI